jgi:predicted Zn-dependent protease
MDKKTGYLLAVFLVALLFVQFIFKTNVFASSISINPMRNWNYNSSYGNYLSLIKTSIKQQYKDNRLDIEDFRFRQFPVKYWIQPMNPRWEAQIKEAITEFSYYFPMQEVYTRQEATLTLEITNYPKLCKLMGTNRKSLYAAGGMEIRNILHDGIVVERNIKADIHFLPKTFDNASTKKIILHELGHAFGIQAHSHNSADVMYPKDSVYKVTKLSTRDLNTLWLVYNQW